MNISGILVQCLPERQAEITNRLESLEGVEVHISSTDGRIVLTVEEAGSEPTSGRFMEINDLDGVLSAMLVYHQLIEEEKNAESA